MQNLTKVISADFHRHYQKKISLVMFFKEYFLNLSFRVVVRYRLQKYMWESKFRLFKIISVIIRNGNIKKYGVEIGLNSKIGSGIVFHHLNGIVIGDNVVIGENTNLYQQVTLGLKNGAYPTIGDNVIIYAGAKIVGGVLIGENAVIGANSFISRNVESNAVAYGFNKIKHS
ncbi:serine O-acetyltransferase [Paenibacillus sp. SYP-B4298]|uniref:serine O-acetyltransferase n=1 Tax=Paenibacillus sp. SYP-B4298 TaxID=2996034 RepID=UPI0022DD6F7B|nr:serine acetyltransferase [Paenibacillus sp. SYP-B4298]